MIPFLPFISCAFLGLLSIPPKAVLSTAAKSCAPRLLP